jgi:hypothetical protein
LGVSGALKCPIIAATFHRSITALIGCLTAYQLSPVMVEKPRRTPKDSTVGIVRKVLYTTNTTITNITTMVVPFAPHKALDLWIRLIVRADPLPKGSGGRVVEANNLNRYTS